MVGTEAISTTLPVVGNLHPILAQVPTYIEQAVMSAAPEEEDDVLISQFEQKLYVPSRGLVIEDIVVIDVEAELAEIRKLPPLTPFTAEQIEQLFTTSALLKSKGVVFGAFGDCCWELTFQGRKFNIPF